MGGVMGIFEDRTYSIFFVQFVENWYSFNNFIKFYDRWKFWIYLSNLSKFWTAEYCYRFSKISVKMKS